MSSETGDHSSCGRPEEATAAKTSTRRTVEREKEAPYVYDLLHAPSHQFKVEGITFTLQGHSRAGERTGYWVKELDLHLDAGVNSLKPPSTLFLSHCHPDHCSALPQLLSKSSRRTKIFLPFSAIAPVSSLLESYARLYAGEDDAVMDFPSLCDFRPVHNLDVPRAYLPSDRPVNMNHYQEPDGCLSLHEAERMRLGSHNCLVRYCRCDHRVDSVGYGVSCLKSERKKEYEGLDNNQMRELKQKNPDIQLSDTREVGLFLFMGDTTIKAFEDLQARWVFSHYPLVIVECTFWKDLPGEEEKAFVRGHIHWNQLRPFVEANPATTFILSHHSLSSSVGQIVDFFRPLSAVCPNVVLWLEPSPVFLSDLIPQ